MPFKNHHSYHLQSLHLKWSTTKNISPNPPITAYDKTESLMSVLGNSCQATPTYLHHRKHQNKIIKRFSHPFTEFIAHYWALTMLLLNQNKLRIQWQQNSLTHQGNWNQQQIYPSCRWILILKNEFNLELQPTKSYTQNPRTGSAVFLTRFPYKTLFKFAHLHSLINSLNYVFVHDSTNQFYIISFKNVEKTLPLHQFLLTHEPISKLILRHLHLLSKDAFYSNSRRPLRLIKKN